MNNIEKIIREEYNQIKLNIDLPKLLIEAVLPITLVVASSTQLYVYGNTPPLAVTNILPSLDPATVIGVTEIGAVNEVF